MRNKENKILTILAYYVKRSLTLQWLTLVSSAWKPTNIQKTFININTFTQMNIQTSPLQVMNTMVTCLL